MPTLFHAPSVDPAAVTPTDVAAILAEHGVNTSEPVTADFFQPRRTYRRSDDEFRCLATGWARTGPVALGLVPVNLGGRRRWEFSYMTPWDWQRGWTAAGPDADNINSNKEG